MRYYRGTYFIGIAIKANLAQHDKNGERNKDYSSVDDVILQNEDCCHVHYNDSVMYVTPLSRLIGLNELVVNVY